jgi:tetratricopeptide (TPR) repeat protein
MARKQRAQPAPGPLSRHPGLVLVVVVALVYGRLFFAGFVRFDDDLHVYANPFLNPPTLQGLGHLWRHVYEHLYVPLAYSIYAALAAVGRVGMRMDGSIGQSVGLSAAPFHAAGIALHAVNAWLCWRLIRRLTGRTGAAWWGALLFALHPLQLESVGWISELRGVASGSFVLLALNLFVLSRQTAGRATALRLWGVATLLVACAMLCKPSAVVMPLLGLAIDRVLLRTPWRKALLGAAAWAAVVLPVALITNATQDVSEAGRSLGWQRPFIAGDALAFYVWKTLVPLRLSVGNGRTPQAVMSHAWGYLTWVLPASLLIVAFVYRRRHPLAWLGALLFVIFLLPTSGLVPFTYQAYSTVADRYAYLALIGVALVIAELAERVKSRSRLSGGAGVILVGLAALSFHQSGYWMTSAALLRHAIDVNPEAAFAYNNLADVELGNGDLPAALADYQACAQHDPNGAKAYINLAEVYTALDRPAQAEEAIAHVEHASGMTADDLSNLGVVLMKMNQPARALPALAAAVTMDASSPAYLFNQGNALAATGQLSEAEAVFRRCLALAPGVVGAHTGLGIVLAESGRLPEAVAEFRAALALRPDDPAALDDLKKAEALLQQP